MLNFRNTGIVALLAIILAVIADVTHGIPVLVYMTIAFVYSVIVAYGCYFIGSNFFIPVICSGQTDKKEIAISFDDGPAGYTLQILKLLKENNIPAAFFCIGRHIEGNEAILQQIHQDGHVIGNHSFSHHFWFDLFPFKKMLADMQSMDHSVLAITGLSPRLFRPPYGVTNPAVKRAVINGNYTPVGWSARTMDTVIKDENKLLDRACKQLKPGAIYLFHDTSQTALAILPLFIRHVTEKGYRIVRLDKMLNLQPYA